MERCNSVRIDGKGKVNMTDEIKDQIMAVIQRYGTGVCVCVFMCVCVHACGWMLWSYLHGGDWACNDGWHSSTHMHPHTYTG